jgi:hypothetical protein
MEKEIEHKRSRQIFGAAASGNYGSATSRTNTVSLLHMDSVNQANGNLALRWGLTGVYQALRNGGQALLTVIECSVSYCMFTPQAMF